VLLARLAVADSCKGQGLGASLLQDAFLRFMKAQEVIGARALLAHAKDAAAKAFYEKWGFVSTEGLPLHLYILTKNIKAVLNR
jgi:GNAT superfamily N-acetyltransferase